MPLTLESRFLFNHRFTIMTNRVYYDKLICIHTVPYATHRIKQRLYHHAYILC
jgi:hypothetical protein